MLIVDDNEINRRVLCERITGWRLRNAVCASGKEALKVLHEGHAAGDPFQIAILDFQMPDMDGEMLGRSIKADPVLRDTSLVMLTSLGMRGDAARLRAAGFSAYLAKPARQSELFDALIEIWAVRTQGFARGLITHHSIAESRTAKTARRAAVQRTCARVLLAEDNVVNQKIAVMMLKSIGCEVDVAANGKEAMQMLDAASYDIVFMDCEMPEMDGFEATAAVRRRPDAKREIPIVAVTAKAIQGDRERCLEAGMNDYMTKPVKQESFWAALERWVPETSKQPKASVISRPRSDRRRWEAAEGGVAPPALDREVIANLRALAESTDASLLNQIFYSFLSDTGERLIALRRAADSGDALALKKVAHALKGASVNIGAHGMAEASQALQALGEAGSLDGASALIGRLEQEFSRVKVELERQLEANAP